MIEELFRRHLRAIQRLESYRRTHVPVDYMFETSGNDR